MRKLLVSNSRIKLMIVLTLLLTANVAQAQNSTIVYQGRLQDTGIAASGTYDMQFKLFDKLELDTGTQHGGTITRSGVEVSNGVFTVSLSFAPCVTCFDGSDRFLEIAVKLSTGSTFIRVSPRQPITSTPYALRSLNADVADGLSAECVNCVSSDQIRSLEGSKITGNIAGNQIIGTIPVASVPPGSSSYIQNTTSPQTPSNFNISGDGRAAGTLSADVVKATTQYNFGINGFRILSASGGGFGDRNLFVGADAGKSNPTGLANTFVGRAAGAANTSGDLNSFFGADAAVNNLSGNSNTAIGASTVVSNDLDHATAIGANASVNTSNTIVLGRSNREDRVFVPGLLRVGTLAGSGGSMPLCINQGDLASCSSSRRYKTGVEPFAGGLALVKLLQPITFAWKENGIRDVGLIAEDVAAIHPLFTFRNSKGQIEGVKYDRVSMVLVNAIKEQQAEIQKQQQQLTTLQQQITTLQIQLKSVMGHGKRKRPARLR